MSNETERKIISTADETDGSASSTFVVTADEAGVRLDAYLAGKIAGWSRSRLQRLVENEDILVNDKGAKPSYKIRKGDEIEVDLVEVPAERFEPENIPLDIVYEDEYLAVINKPAGMVVHPGAGVQSGTLANAIAYHFSLEAPASAGGTPSEARIGIVHRLDKDTSGLIVVAKTDEIHEALSEQFRERLVYKSYVALVHGSPDQNTGKIEAPIGRNKHNRLRMKVAIYGRSALSLWKVRKRYGKFTLLEVEIKTGRTHQIRVHMGYINHPVVGDEIYNEGRDNTVADMNVRKAIASMNRFFLHAEKLSFTHPKIGGRMEYIQPLPPELNQFLDLL
ncbi:MAG: RluA family pseudouridine synthase [Pyrinomonadaceae bacterium]|nr:RluA family pseudouridine synthase [Pyrinomonadaceae bacterium]